MSDQNPKKQNWTRAYLCLGSNEGDRVGYVQQAMQLLKDYPGIEIVECSSFYETEPIGGNYIDWFVNAVAIIETSLSAQELFSVCKQIEQRIASMVGEPQSKLVKEGVFGITKSCIIALDILFYGNKRTKLPDFIIPHPQLTKSAFVLVPLLEIAPKFVHPLSGKTITQIHKELEAPEQVYLYGTRDVIPDL